eukprot:GHUV01034966.1.p1 GENE.GHUV01034966.1~~GHUV01034966.1.p1  ORF type:complete len:406 (+),score=154.44 GHUV01034966.1:2505-3722(+)
MAVCSGDIQVHIGAAQGCVAVLLQLLSSRDEHVQEQAALTLGGLALRCPKNQAAIATAGAIPVLLQLQFNDGTVKCSPDVQHAAAMALVGVAAGNKEIAAAIATEPNIQRLLQQITRCSSLEERDDAAMVLLAPVLTDQLSALDKSNIQAAIATAEGGIQALVSLLKCSNEEVHMGAASVLGGLAETSPELATQIAAIDGSIGLLVQRLQPGNSIKMKAVAAAALHHMAVGRPEIQAAIAGAEGCIPALVQLLDDVTDSEPVAKGDIHFRQEAAALALGAIAPTSTSIQEQVATATGCASALVKLLQSSNNDVKYAAAGILAVISGDSRSDILVAAGAVGPLVHLLHSSNGSSCLELPCIAATALGFMAQGSQQVPRQLQTQGPSLILCSYYLVSQRYKNQLPLR